MKYLILLAVIFIFASCKIGFKSGADYIENAPKNNEEIYLELDKLGLDRDKLFYISPDANMSTKLKIHAALLSDNMVYYTTVKSVKGDIYMNEVWNKGGDNCGYISDDIMSASNQRIVEEGEFLNFNLPLINHRKEFLVLPENKNILILKYGYALGHKLPRDDVKKIKTFLQRHPDYDYIVLGVDQYF
jgi:hypothetical protein